MDGKEEPMEFISVEEAARVLKTTAPNVLLHLKRNLLAGREVNETWEVSRHTLSLFFRDGQEREVLEPCRKSCLKKSGCGSCG